MSNLFVYGALMYGDIWKHVVKGNCKKYKGKLSGYRRLKIHNKIYPGLVNGNGEVDGYIRINVSD